MNKPLDDHTWAVKALRYWLERITLRAAEHFESVAAELRAKP